MNIDHVVLWVEDPKASLDFYCDVLGMEAVRAEEYRQGNAPFPSARIDDGCIIDLMSRQMLKGTTTLTGASAGGQALNHLCLNLDAETYTRLCKRLTEQGVRLNPGPETSFGARGYTPHSVYFQDPDGNVLELRHYE